MSKVKIHLIAAARPNFMKVAPLYHAISRSDWADPVLVHTGQHYDENMSDAILRDLGLPKPDFHLGVGSGTHAEQTGNVMIGYEKLCNEHRPDCIVVVGDVNSTAACAQVGTKLWIPVVHLEAGLRSGDRRMPEEINRLITDAIADVLWTPSSDADDNLIAEGVSVDRIDRIGNIMIDSFEMLREQIDASTARLDIGVEKNEYALVTLHRPSNVDSVDTLTPIVDLLTHISEKIKITIVAHPRTMNSLEKFGLRSSLEDAENVMLVKPMPYIKFMNVVVGAKLVITDSGGLQEETTYLGIPCLTLRENTERPITISMGTNRLVNLPQIEANLVNILDGKWPDGQCPPLWDGHTAERAVAALKKRYG